MIFRKKMKKKSHDATGFGYFAEKIKIKIAQPQLCYTHPDRAIAAYTFLREYGNFS